MKVAVLIYGVKRRRKNRQVEASLAWVDPFAGKVLNSIPVPISPNLGIFSKQDCALVSYAEFPEDAPQRDWLDVYRLSDWTLQAHLLMDCRAHFNVSPRWSTFLPGPDDHLIYVYKSRTLGDHWAEDFVCGLDLTSLSLTGWNYRIPGCVAGWSTAGGRAHAQILFQADGLENGRLRLASNEQRMGFWLGPEEEMGPTISMGPCPPAHNDPGHAGAILSASRRPLSAVVCSDGAVHLIDPVTFRYLERQQVVFRDEYAMPLYAAHLEPQGRLLYVCLARGEALHQGLAECIVMHDLDSGRTCGEWMPAEALVHTALTDDGKYICGVSRKSNTLWVRDALTGQAESQMPLHGSLQYLAVS